MAFQEMDKIVQRFFDNPAFTAPANSRREERADRWMNERYGELLDLCKSGKRVEGGWYMSHTASVRDDCIAFLMDNDCFQEICEAFDGKTARGYALYVSERVDQEALEADRNGAFDEQE
jgi:hypothetical protein